jgi:hypothetical protein
VYSTLPQIRSSTDWNAVVEEAFKSLLTDPQGRLTPADLELLLCGAEGCEVEDFVNAALREADVDHDGGLSLEEFRALVSGRHESSLDLFEARLAGPRADGAAASAPEGDGRG